MSSTDTSYWSHSGRHARLADFTLDMHSTYYPLFTSCAHFVNISPAGFFSNRDL